MDCFAVVVPTENRKRTVVIMQAAETRAGRVPSIPRPDHTSVGRARFSRLLSTAMRSRGTSLCVQYPLGDERGTCRMISLARQWGVTPENSRSFFYPAF